MKRGLDYEAARSADARRAQRRKTRDPLMGGTIHARYSSTCSACGEAINPGDEISPGGKGRHVHTVCPARRARRQRVVSLRPGQEGRPDGMLHQG